MVVFKTLTQAAASVSLYVVASVLAVIAAFPFLWMLSTSLKDRRQALQLPPVWIPDPLILSTYTELFRLLPFGTFFTNSLKIAILVTVGRIVFCSLAGYGFARFNFKGKNLMFAVLLAALMIPPQITIIPLYVGYRSVGWLDTHWPLIIPGIFANTFSTFLMRQFFATIPRELDEAARIDGCSSLGILWHILLPLSKPALATLAIFSFMTTWNDFFGPVVFLSSQANYTVPVGLSFFQDAYSAEYPLLMAGAVLALLPIVLVYLFAQKYFTEGIALTGIKG